MGQDLDGKRAWYPGASTPQRSQSKTKPMKRYPEGIGGSKGKSRRLDNAKKREGSYKATIQPSVGGCCRLGNREGGHGGREWFTWGGN